MHGLVDLSSIDDDEDEEGVVEERVDTEKGALPRKVRTSSH